MRAWSLGLRVWDLGDWVFCHSGRVGVNVKACRIGLRGSVALLSIDSACSQDNGLWRILFALSTWRPQRVRECTLTAPAFTLNTSSPCCSGYAFSISRHDPRRCTDNMAWKSKEVNLPTLQCQTSMSISELLALSKASLETLTPPQLYELAKPFFTPVPESTSSVSTSS